MAHKRFASVDATFNRFKRITASALLILTVSTGAVMATIGPDTPGRLMGDLSRDLGLTNYQAAGIVGNFSVETGGFKHQQELAPTVPGSRGGYGMAQWTGSRRVALEAHAASMGLPASSYEAQYSYLLKELNGPYAGVLKEMQNAASVEEAAHIFMKKFEVPGVEHWDKRLAEAMKAANGDFGSMSGGGIGGSSESIEWLELNLMPWKA